MGTLEKISSNVHTPTYQSATLAWRVTVLIMDEVDEPIPVIQRNEEKKEKINEKKGQATRTWRDYSETKDYKRETGGARPWPDVADWETPGIEILFLTRTHTQSTRTHTLSLSFFSSPCCVLSLLLPLLDREAASLPPSQ